jgi:hypothetical protein
VWVGHGKLLYTESGIGCGYLLLYTILVVLSTVFGYDSPHFLLRFTMARYTRSPTPLTTAVTMTKITARE